MSTELRIRELWETIEAAGRNPTDFHIAVHQKESGWVVVRSRGVVRSYPIGGETKILLSAEIRHGKFGR
jgi:hypothetical protein